MWNRTLGQSEAFVGRPDVMKRFFPPAEPEFSENGGVPGPRWPPPRYAVPEIPEAGVGPPVPTGWPTAAPNEVRPQLSEVTSGTADERSCYLRRIAPRRPDGTRLTRPERRVQWIRRVNEASRIRTFLLVPYESVGCERCRPMTLFGVRGGLTLQSTAATASWFARSSRAQCGTCTSACPVPPSRQHSGASQGFAPSPTRSGRRACLRLPRQTPSCGTCCR